jgi:integrase/recombinase XerD
MSELVKLGGKNMSAKIISEKEQKQIFKAIELSNHSDRNRLIFSFGLLAGLRSCELSNLKVSDVVDDANKVKDVINLKAEQVKGNKTNRIFVSDKLKKEILMYIAKVPMKLEKQHDYLFKTQKRTQFKAQSMQLLIKGICNEGNVFGVTSHSLRRTFITGLSNKMMNARVIQKLARHSSLAVTQLYIETNDSQLLKAVNL